MPERRHTVGIVFDRLIDGDRPCLQIHVIPCQRGQLPAAQARKHHNDRYRLRTVRRVPYPLLFLGGQSAALLRFSANGGKLYLLDRIRWNDTPYSPTHDLSHGRAIQIYSALSEPLIGQCDQYPLHIVGTHLTDLIAWQLLFPELYCSTVVVHLSAGDLFLLLQAEPIIRPCGKAVTLGENVKALTELEPDRGFLLLQLCRRLRIDALIFALTVFIAAQIDLRAIAPIGALLCSGHVLTPCLLSNSMLFCLWRCRTAAVSPRQGAASLPSDLARACERRAAQWLHTRTCSSFVFSSLVFAACLSRRIKRSDRRHPDKYGDHFKALLGG